MSAVKPTVNRPDGAPKIIRLPDGSVVSKQYYDNGNYTTKRLFAPDHPDAVLEVREIPKPKKREE